MSGETKVLAFDFGASSGRAILASYEDGTFSYREIHRFENIPHEENGRLCWDFDTLLAEVRNGIDKAGVFDSIGFDTWGVDFGLLDKNGRILANPVHYRDSRTDGVVEQALKIMDAKSMYGKTGTQIIFFNTLIQLIALKEQQPELLKEAKTLLFMPDLFSYAMSGMPACERSIASTSQMLDPETGSWRRDVLEAFKIPAEILLEPVKSGTVTGRMPNGAKVIAVAGHDTQCASAAVPTCDRNVAFLSCGTWSLLGTELDRPILSEKSMRLGLSNELGANGRVNYLKNIIGLWLIQESRRAWRKKGEEYSYADLERLALEAEPFRSFIDPDAPEFSPPGDIPGRVQAFCQRTNQKVPQTVGEIMRCIYESLALKYRYAVGQLRDVTGKPFSALHILGGGTKDRLLCQMSANSTGLPVVAGPVEATALGNIVIQLVALGKLAGIDDGRALIAKTETLKHYAPADTGLWDKAYETFTTILQKER